MRVYKLQKNFGNSMVVNNITNLFHSIVSIYTQHERYVYLPESQSKTKRRFCLVFLKKKKSARITTNLFNTISAQRRIGCFSVAREMYFYWTSPS